MMINQRKKAIILFFVSLIIFFVSFQFNFFNVANTKYFQTYDLGSEALIIGRMVKSRESGLLSSGGRLGIYEELIGERNEIQNQLYSKKIEGGTYKAYTSSLGGQGIVFSLIDNFLDYNNLLEKEERIDFFHSLTSFTLAFILAFFMLLLFFEIGFIPVLLVLIFTILCQWLVLIGKNFYWMVSLSFIPMIIIWQMHKYEEIKNNIYLKFTLFLLFASLFLKLSAGYEYISTILLSTLIPIVYFSIKNAWSIKKFFERCIIIGLTGLLAFVMTFCIHLFQTSVVANIPISKALTIRLDDAKTRMYAEKDLFVQETWNLAAQASTIDVVKLYLNTKAIDFRRLLHWRILGEIYYKDLIMLFFGFSFLALSSKIYTKNLASNRKKILALAITVWASFLAPMSWFTLAKVHSFVHVTYNNWLWHMPFMILGFSLVSFIIYLLLKDLYEFNKAFLILVLCIIFIFILGPYATYKVEYNQKITNILNDINQDSSEKIKSVSGFQISFTEDNELVYYKSSCQDVNLSIPFALRLYNSDAHQFNNLDFTWMEYKVDIPKQLLSYKNSCLAIIKLPLNMFDQIQTGQYEKNSWLWQENIDLYKIIKKYSIVSYNLSDDNWKKGISISIAGLFIKNNIQNRLSLSKNDILEFSFSGLRNIANLSYHGEYINIDLNGSVLDPLKDGYPNQIKILH